MDATLAKGLTVLDWLVRQQRPCRVVEVAQAFGLARSNAHRTLQTLVECGWAQQDAATSSYRPSLRLFELGALVESVADLRLLMRPHLAALSAATGETIHLAVLDGAEIVYLDKFDSPLPVAAYSRIGGRAPGAVCGLGQGPAGRAGRWTNRRCAAASASCRTHAAQPDRHRRAAARAEAGARARPRREPRGMARRCLRPRRAGLRRARRAGGRRRHQRPFHPLSPGRVHARWRSNWCTRARLACSHPGLSSGEPARAVPLTPPGDRHETTRQNLARCRRRRAGRAALRACRRKPPTPTSRCASWCPTRRAAAPTSSRASCSPSSSRCWGRPS
jgi:DNA-binding IclR family transcriptional regulator